MDAFTQPTDAEINELLDLLEECYNLGGEAFRSKLLARAKECGWQWLPPTKPQQWFNRTAMFIASEWSFERFTAIQARLDGKPMPAPGSLRQLVARAIREGEAEPE